MFVLNHTLSINPELIESLLGIYTAKVIVFSLPTMFNEKIDVNILSKGRIKYQESFNILLNRNYLF